MALRADSYHTIRVMDLALTGWVSFWVEAQELQQKAAFFRERREVEQRMALLRAWQQHAARLRKKRHSREM
jgi:sensor histidine kinase regulating citrate/malate metabolism